MRRIVKIALAAALAAAAAQAVRWLLQQDVEAARQLPRPKPTREQLYGEARRLDIGGRSKMNKQELQQAVEAAKTGGST
jgi:hypothetical protein